MQLLLVQEDGFLKPLTEVGDSFSASNVLIAVHEETKRIFIWKGAETNIRKKFISAQAAQKIRFDDMAYVTISIDQGENSKEEKELSELAQIEKITPPRPKIEAPRPSASSIREAASKPSPPQIGSGPLPSGKPSTGKSGSVAFSTDAQLTSRTGNIDARPVLTSAIQVLPKDVLGQIQEMELPEGYEREAVIIGNSMFTVMETRHSLFGRTTQETELKKMDSPPDGVYLASETTPRIVIKGSKVFFSEFLKKTEEVPERIKKDLDRLGQVIAKGMDVKSDKDLASLGKPISKLFHSKKSDR